VSYAISVFCIIIAFAPHALHHIALGSYICLYALDHAESEFEEPTQQTQAEDLTNLALDQGKPRCI
jgi:hypothetical protein